MKPQFLLKKAKEYLQGLKSLSIHIQWFHCRKTGGKLMYMTKSLRSLFMFLLCGGGMGVYRRCSAGSSRMIQYQTARHLSPALYSLITCSKGVLVTLYEAFCLSNNSRVSFLTASASPFVTPVTLSGPMEARSLYSSTKRSLRFSYSPQSSFLVGYEWIFKYSTDLLLTTNKQTGISSCMKCTEETSQSNQMKYSQHSDRRENNLKAATNGVLPCQACQ